MMTEEELMQLLKKNLRLEIVEGESYNGGMVEGRSMYDKYVNVQLFFGDTCLSSVSIG